MRPSRTGRSTTRKTIRVALAAAFIIATEKTTVARDKARIACTEQRRALITGRKIGEFSNDGGARIVDRHACV
jgi:hypothetical protein